MQKFLHGIDAGGTITARMPCVKYVLSDAKKKTAVMTTNENTQHSELARRQTFHVEKIVYIQCACHMGVTIVSLYVQGRRWPTNHDGKQGFP